MTEPRVLFTTVPVEVLRGSNRLKGRAFDTTSSYQSWTAMNPSALQLRVSNPAFGLRFLQENVPGVEILEYPTWREYRTALGLGYDIVGISFFTWTAPSALHMVQMAREAGVAKVWGGNYGVTTPGVGAYFDRLFAGNCESEVHQVLRGRPLDEIKHPVILGRSKMARWKSNIGYLYTRRGCGMQCTFCPTPGFAPWTDNIGVPEIRRVLDAYKAADAGPIVIFDETFLAHTEESRIVIEEMAARGLKWVCLTRADRIVGRVGELAKKGLHSAIIGVESLRDYNLSFVEKRINKQLLREVIDELRSHNCLPTGTYMLGFPDDTEKSVREDIRELASWGFFLMQFTILTPFPGAELREQFADRLSCTDWSQYDTYHLVWDHPHLTPPQARDLLYQALRKINRPREYLWQMSKYYARSRARQLLRRST